MKSCVARRCARIKEQDRRHLDYIKTKHGLRSVTKNSKKSLLQNTHSEPSIETAAYELASAKENIESSNSSGNAKAERKVKLAMKQLVRMQSLSKQIRRDDEPKELNLVSTVAEEHKDIKLPGMHIETFDLDEEEDFDDDYNSINNVAYNVVRSGSDEKKFIISVQEELGRLLRNYRSGAMPKVFQQVVESDVWLDILAGSEPTRWSGSALVSVTNKFFGVSTYEKCSQYCQYILINVFKSAVNHDKKMNTFFLQTMKIVISKGTPFFEGFLLPIIYSPTNKLEADTICTLISRSSFQSAHISALYFQMSTIPITSEYAYALYRVVHALLKKNHRLPEIAITALVNIYEGFLTLKEFSPFADFHRGLLMVLEKFGDILSVNDIDRITNIANKIPHHAISAAINAKAKEYKKLIS